MLNQESPHVGTYFGVSVLYSDSVLFLTDFSLNDIKMLLNRYAKYLHKSNLTGLETEF